MKNKRNILFSSVLVILIIGMIFFMINNDDKSKNDNSEKISTSNEDNESADKWQVIKDEMIENTADTHGNKNIQKGTYPDRPGSLELNSEYFYKGYEIDDNMQSVHVEYTSYEEIDDLSDYIGRGIENDSNMVNAFIDYGIIGIDGSINSVTYKVRDRIDEGKYGDWIVKENFQSVVIKIGIKITNLTDKKITTNLQYFATVDDYIKMDNNKFYTTSTIYNRNIIYDTQQPLYISFTDRRVDNQLASVIYMEANETIEGDMIFVLPKQEIQNYYLRINPVDENVSNFNCVYVKLIPFSYLMELEK